MATGDQFEPLAEDKYPAELGAFNYYFNNMKLYLNPSTMQGKLISLGLVDGSIIGGGAAVFLPDHIKMETMLIEVRRNIAVNGPKSFGLLIKAINSVGAYRNLAGEIASKCLKNDSRTDIKTTCVVEKYQELKDELLADTKNTGGG